MHGDPKAEIHVTDVAYLGYKKWPNHIPHWNPKDPNYVYSERDEINLKYAIDDHNYVVY